MEKLIKLILLLLYVLITSCKGQYNEKANSYSFELQESDDQAYDMRDWSLEKREEYYKRCGNLIADLLRENGYTTPDNGVFIERIKKIFDYEVDTSKSYQEISLINSNDGHSANEIIIFPKLKIIALNNELPLLDSSSLNYYKSKDYKGMDHSYDNNLNLNKLLFANNIDYNKSKTVIAELQNNRINLFIDKIYEFGVDLNQDSIIDSILVFGNRLEANKYEREHFHLSFLVKKGVDKNIFQTLGTNTNIFSPNTNCYTEGFQNIVTNLNYFTIEGQICTNQDLIFTYITFKMKNNTILLHKYGESYLNDDDSSLKNDKICIIVKSNRTANLK